MPYMEYIADIQSYMSFDIFFVITQSKKKIYRDSLN